MPMVRHDYFIRLPALEGMETHFLQDKDYGKGFNKNVVRIKK